MEQKYEKKLNLITQVDSEGRITIPLTVMEQIGVATGDYLEIYTNSFREIIFKKVSEEYVLKRRARHTILKALNFFQTHPETWQYDDNEKGITYIYTENDPVVLIYENGEQKGGMYFSELVEKLCI